MFLKARPLNKEQTYMRVNLCIVLYIYIIIYIMFTFDSELKLILTLLCKNPTMRFKQYEKAFLFKITSVPLKRDDY